MPQSVTLYRDAQHGASVDLGLQTEIMIMPVKTRARQEGGGTGHWGSWGNETQAKENILNDIERN